MNRFRFISSRKSTHFTLITVILLFLVFTISYQANAAEAPDLEWQKFFYGKGESCGVGRSVQQTTDGGYIIGGSSTSNNNSNICLIKTDSLGNLAWEKTYGSTATECGNSVQQTTDGGYIIVGYTSTGTGKDKIYLVKTDSNGNKLWDKTYGSSGWENGHYVQQTSDGGYIIVGSTHARIYLIKTDSSGNQLWEKVFSYNNFTSYSYSVQQTVDGGYIISGWTGHYDNSTGIEHRDAYLFKTDSDGNKQWEKIFGGNKFDYGTSVKQTSDGGYIVAGSTESYGAGDWDIYLVKFNSSGNILWEKTYGHNPSDFGYFVEQTRDGGYIIIGYTGSNNYDIYVIRTNILGNLIWEKQLSTGGHHDYGKCVQQANDGGYIIQGNSYAICLYKLKPDKDNTPPDTTPPMTTIKITGTIGNNDWYSSGVQIDLNADDNLGGSGISKIEYSINGESWNQYLNPIFLNNDGVYTINCQSTDNTGNVEMVISKEIKIDKTPPIITCEPTTPPNVNNWYNTDIVMHFSASDNLSGINSVTPDTIISIEGANQAVNGSALDMAGNSATCNVTGINIDKTAPTISIISPLSGPYLTSENIAIEYSASDNISGIDKVVAILDDSQVSNGQVIGLATQAGNHKFIVTAYDNAGNENSKTVDFEVLINSTVDIKPDTLNMKSQSDKNAVTMYVEFPSGYDVNQIDVDNIQIIVNGITIPAQFSNSEVADFDSDGVPDKMIKFDRQLIKTALSNMIGDVSITAFGLLKDNRGFKGTDIIRVQQESPQSKK